MEKSTLIALAVLNLGQLAVLVRVHARLKGTERVNERLSHFAEALALLTDTTEAGLSGVAAALEQPRRASRAGSRASTGKRIATAARKGRSLTQIAADEAMSESEVRLHLEMAAGANEGKEAGRGAVRI